MQRTFSIPVYNCKVVLIVEPDINDAIRRVYKKHRLGSHEEFWYAGVVWPTENIHTYYLLYGSKYLTINMFVHEISHLGNRILRDRGHNSSADDEPLAYLNGHLAETVHSILQKQNIPFVTK